MINTITGQANSIDKEITRTELQTSNQELPKLKKKYPSCLRNVYHYLSEYSDSSSLHGIKYIGERNRTIFEKLWWLIVFSASLYYCIYMISKTYEKWQMSPVIVSFAQTSTPIWEIPFPAVTICPDTKSKQRIFNYTRMYIKYLYGTIKEENEILEKISLVCHTELHNEDSLEFIDYDTISLFENVAPTLDEVFFQCRWMNEVADCKQLFTPVLSEDGICFTFNMLNREELFTNTVLKVDEYLHHGIRSTNWSLEGGYLKNVINDVYPRRAISAVQGAGLNVLLRAYSHDLEYLCTGPTQGFKVLLHHPAEISSVSQQSFQAPLDQEIVIAVKPDMMTTSEGLTAYSPHKRQCYFSIERQLRFYQVYSQQNCEMECLANYTYQKCNCVSYHMPHDEYTPMCGAGKTICVTNARNELLTAEVEKNLDDSLTKDPAALNFIGHETCDCLPACTSLVYNSENSQADFHWTKVFHAKKMSLKGLSNAHMTTLSIFFKEIQFITSERNELYGPIDFLANCGGLLGLFIGFSLLSVIEVVHFISLRLLCNIKNYGRHFWSGSEELLENDAHYLTRNSRIRDLENDAFRQHLSSSGYSLNPTN